MLTGKRVVATTQGKGAMIRTGTGGVIRVDDGVRRAGQGF